MSSRILRLKTVALIDRGIERLTARDSQAPVARRQFLFGQRDIAGRRLPCGVRRCRSTWRGARARLRRPEERKRGAVAASAHQHGPRVAGGDCRR